MCYHVPDPCFNAYMNSFWMCGAGRIYRTSWYILKSHCCIISTQYNFTYGSRRMLHLRNTLSICHEAGSKMTKICLHWSRPASMSGVLDNSIVQRWSTSGELWSPNPWFWSPEIILSQIVGPAPSCGRPTRSSSPSLRKPTWMLGWRELDSCLT